MADPGNDSDSDISNISGGSEMAWRPMAGPMAWVQEQMMAGKDPRVILRRIIPDPDIIPDHLEDFILWKIVASIVSEPPRRKKLKHINTVDDVVTLLKTSKKIMVLTGAGVSVSCGIPDFRSRNGIYARLAVDFPDLPDPQAMFDISYFRHDPRPFFKFAKEIYPGQFEPSRCHKFISLLDRKGKLLRNYTQNIDTLEQVAGIKNVIQCHGSFATATCMTCRYKVDAEAVRKDIFDQVIPHCPRCSPSSTEAVMKPDIVFFGESLPEEFHTQMAADKDVCDLLIVVGSSLKVRPVALIPNSIPAEIPQVLINREPLRHLNFDVELLGDCDVILGELCHRLGGEWSDLFTDYTRLEEVTKGELSTPTVSDSDNGKVSLASSSDPSQQASSTSVQSCSTTETNSALNNAEISCISEIKSEGDVAPCDTKALCSSDAKAKDNVSTIPCQSGASNLPDSNGGSHASAVHTKGDNSPKSSQSRGQDHDNENCTSEHGESGVSAATLRDWWQSRHSSISSRLLSNQYLYVPPHRYVFNGAEVYSDSESEDGQYDDADEESSLSSFGAADSEPSKSVCEMADDKGKMDKSRHIESCSDVPHGRASRMVLL
ncbi:NAD-dependent protein deacetylase sirtuin-1-like isoform X2 [Liolophura sinensis]|uniref:NAD-dependent protein deacetylase sirtuin-1-like isoform X2 n=1 Tax=Liolophura sinensis TaxID=3198878 RepID=UPI0031587802